MDYFERGLRVRHRQWARARAVDVTGCPASRSICRRPQPREGDDRFLSAAAGDARSFGAGFLAPSRARVLTSPRKVLLIRSHTRRSDRECARAGACGPGIAGLLPVFLGERGGPLGLVIPTFGRPKSRIARTSCRSAPIFVATPDMAGPNPPRARPAGCAQYLLWHGMPHQGHRQVRSVVQGELARASRATSPSPPPGAWWRSCRNPSTSRLRTVRDLGRAEDRSIADRSVPAGIVARRFGTHYRAVVGYFPTWREKIVEIGGRVAATRR